MAWGERIEFWRTGLGLSPEKFKYLKIISGTIGSKGDQTAAPNVLGEKEV